MASLIEWLNRRGFPPGETWNFIKGCEHVSPGCAGCYAVPQSHMRAHNPAPGVAKQFAGLVHRVNGELKWTGKVNYVEHLLSQPMTWRKGRYVFVNSLSDLFYDEVPREIVAKAFAVMALCPQHVFIVLTKRPGRMRSLLSDPRFWAEVGSHALETYGRWPPEEGVPLGARALPNVVLGVSVENQKWADVRIPQLMQTPAAYRAVSAEPLLGPVDLEGYLRSDAYRCKCGVWERNGVDFPECCECGRPWAQEPGDRLDWVIVGGESGHRARAMHPDWARWIRNQAAKAGVPFFFKQWGEWGPAPFIVRPFCPSIGWTGTEEGLEKAKADSEARGATHVHTANPYLDEGGEVRYHLHEIGHKPWSPERVGLEPPHEPMRRWGKKKAGKLLDGREWTDVPCEPGNPRVKRLVEPAMSEGGSA